MDLNHQYAARMTRDLGMDMYGMGACVTQWIAPGEKPGEYTLVQDEKGAQTCWNRQGAARMIEDYLKKEWNVTMGAKPTFEIVKVHRPMKIHHPW